LHGNNQIIGQLEVKIDDPSVFSATQFD